MVFGAWPRPPLDPPLLSVDGRSQDFFYLGWQIHKRIQDFLWGALFSLKKLTTRGQDRGLQAKTTK